MSSREDRIAGQNYLESEIKKGLIGELSWREPHNQDVSELAISSNGIRRAYTIKNLDLEDPQRRPSLDQLAAAIIQHFV
jgi:hypothetical protein